MGQLLHSQHPQQPQRILVVDDNHDAADLLADIFSLHGYVTAAAYDGAHGLSAISEFAPNVVFLDLGMPGMDGYQVARELRRMPGVRQPYLIAFTAWNDADARQRVIQAGFDLHLTKPAPFHQLLDTVGAIATGGPASKQA